MSEGRFSANEKVLAFHGPLIYEAKVLKVQGQPQKTDSLAKTKDKNPQKADGATGETQKSSSDSKDVKTTSTSSGGSLKYFIHYHGWNKNWDEWVAEPRILKFTESNLERKKELIKAHEANVKAKKAASTSAPAAAAGAAGAGAGPAPHKRRAEVAGADPASSPSQSNSSSQSDNSKSPKVDRSLVV